MGNYFIDHKRRINQLDDPRIEWLAVQANMVIGYLEQASAVNENEQITSTQQQQDQQIYSNTESMVAAANHSSISINEMANTSVENDYMNRNDLALAINNIQIDDLNINGDNTNQHQQSTTVNTNNRSINKINLQFDENSAYAVIDCYSRQQQHQQHNNSNDDLDNYANLSLYNQTTNNVSHSTIDTILDQSLLLATPQPASILPPALPSMPPPLSSIRSAISSQSIGNNYSHINNNINNNNNNNNSRTSSMQSLVAIPSYNKNHNHYGQLSSPLPPPLMTSHQYRQNPLLLQQSLTEAKQRVEQLKRELCSPSSTSPTITMSANNIADHHHHHNNTMMIQSSSSPIQTPPLPSSSSYIKNQNSIPQNHHSNGQSKTNIVPTNRTNDHNNHIFSIIDRYYTKDGQKHTNAIEV